MTRCGPSGSASASHESAIPRAGLTDLEQIFHYLDERSPQGARNVIDAIRAAIGDVASQPLSARRTSDPTIRVKIVGRYNYKIFYSINVDEIEILHVRHGARRPWFPEG